MAEKRFDRAELVRLLKARTGDHSPYFDDEVSLLDEVRKILQEPMPFLTRREAVLYALTLVDCSDRKVKELIRAANLGQCDDWLDKGDDAR